MGGVGPLGLREGAQLPEMDEFAERGIGGEEWVNGVQGSLILAYEGLWDEPAVVR